MSTSIVSMVKQAQVELKKLGLVPAHYTITEITAKTLDGLICDINHENKTIHLRAKPRAVPNFLNAPARARPSFL